MNGGRELWSGRVGFILSTIGSAVGLGSIWKFPYEVGSNGGGVFILFYLVGLALVVFPLMLLEFAIGRRGSSDAVTSIAAVAQEGGVSKRWRLLGALGVLTSFLILSFYSVIGGWTLDYFFSTLFGRLGSQTVSGAQGRFDAMLASPWRMITSHVAFMVLTASIVGRGVATGIEAACKVLMPILIVLIVVLALYSMSEGAVRPALRFLFEIRRSSMSATVVLEALGLGFFSIGVGLAVMITYGAYAGHDIDLKVVAVATIVGDTVVSCLAGLAVFPIVFAENLDPAAGPGLMFVTVPVAFARLPLGTIAALAFFALLAIAALASAVSLLELPVSFVRQFGLSRRMATIICASAAALLGLTSVFSFNIWREWHPVAAIGFGGASAFDVLDALTSNVLLPIAGFGLAIFGGWIVPRGILVDELRLGHVGASLLRACLRFIIPIAVAAAAFAAIRF